MSNKAPHPHGFVTGQRATETEFLGRSSNPHFISVNPEDAHAPQNAMIDESSRKSKIELAAEDGLATAPTTSPGADLGGESTKSVPEQMGSAEAPMSITKPSSFDLDRFTSKRAATVASVETLQTALPHHSIAQAKISSACTPTKKITGRQNSVS